MNKLAKKHGMKEFFKECYECKISEKKLMDELFYTLMYRGNYYDRLVSRNPKATKEEIGEAIYLLTRELKVDVNAPCCTGRQDLMYHAIIDGTAKDVENLILNGYDGSNFISGKTAYEYLVREDYAPERDEKIKLFKSNKLDKIENRSETEFEKYDKVRERQESNFKFLTAEKLEFIHNVNPLAYSILKPYIALNEEKAKTKLVEKLLDLNVSTKDLKNILKNGHFYNQGAYENGKLEYLQVYLDLLDSEGIESPKDLDQEEFSI